MYPKSYIFARFLFRPKKLIINQIIIHKMKKTTLFILFVVCNTIIFSGLFAQQLTYSKLRDSNGISIGLRLDSYEVTSLDYRGEAMHEISLSGIFIPNDEGMPNLPRISRFIAVPKGAEVIVSVKRMDTKTLQNINIAPALRIQAIPEEPVTDYVKNTQVYERNEFYPQNVYEVSEITSLRGVNTVILGITPFQFNPVSKELIVITNVELEIEYIGGSREYDDPKYRSPWFDPILKNAILNYEVLEDIAYTPKSSGSGTGCEYLIVIPNRTDFEPYAQQIKEFRTKQGIYTKVMRLDEMGVTTTAQLKTFFHNAYNTWDIPPVAVLLMADHNTNMALGIPAETIPHSYSGSCITDNQYADVTGDLLPEMVFGRMAAETEAQMVVLVSKFLEYETQPCMEPDYYQNPITALGFQTERWFQICSEAVGGYWRNMGKTPVRINNIYQPPQNTSIWSSNSNTSMVTNYFGPNGTGYIPASPNELGNWDNGSPALVVTAVNSGAFALQHRNHGFENGWGEPAFQSSHISQLTNVGKMTYLFTINCLTGKFNHSTPCFGEVFHRYTYQGQNAGCVGFLGPTEVSYSFVNDAFAWGMYDLYDPNFLPTYGYMGPHAAAYSGNWMPAFGNISGKYFLAQSNWPSNPISKEITYQMFTAHSDVFLRLFTEVPQTNNVSHADVALAGNSNFLISAAAGTLIALTTEIDGNIEILDVAVATGGMQTMTIPSTLLPTTEIKVVVTGQNYLRYEAEVMVVPADGPYIVPTGYQTFGSPELTYISVNSEISVYLKNVGIEATNALTITISTNDPQLTITQNTAQCPGIAPDEVKTANFKVTVANDIPNNKIFSVNVTVTDNGKSQTWESKMSLKAFAPVFSLKKVLVDGVENGSLPKGSLAKITVVVENKGGADAYSVVGDLEINNQFVSIACADGKQRGGQNLPAGESMNFDFIVVTATDMPTGYEVNMKLLLNAMYGRSFTTTFKVLGSVPTLGNTCSSGTQDCSGNDKFTSVQILKGTTVLLSNTNSTCVSGGYQNNTNMVILLEPGETYTIKVKCGYGSQQIGGWFDLNGNNAFDANEKLITMNGGTSETSSTFTIPATATTPGDYRLRLVCKWNSAPIACNNSSYGQTHDYTFTIPNTLPQAQNVNAVLEGADITITWQAPADVTPVGYNIYREGNKLNGATPLTTLSFTETNLDNGIYAYNVTAVYEGNKESYPIMSNIICFFYVCEIPRNLAVTAEGKTAILTWEKPETIEGTFEGYYMYRDGVKLNSTPISTTTYSDANLAVGTYKYQVSAQSDVCTDPEKTEEVSVTILPEFCEPPVNIELTNEETSILIIWKEPVNIDGVIKGYNVHRNDVMINEEIITEKEYRDEQPQGGYYQVSAVYEHCNSELSGKVGIKEVQTSSFNLYPNPTSGELTIDNGQLTINNVEFYDIYGRKQLSIVNCQLSINHINVSHLQSGTYFVKIYSENNVPVIKRLVIIK